MGLDIIVLLAGTDIPEASWCCRLFVLV